MFNKKVGTEIRPEGVHIVFRDGVFHLVWEDVHILWIKNFFGQVFKVREHFPKECLVSSLNQEDYLFKQFVGRPVYDILLSLERGEFVREENCEETIFKHKLLELRLKLCFPQWSGFSVITRGNIEIVGGTWPLPEIAHSALYGYTCYVEEEQRKQKQREADLRQEQARQKIVSLFDLKTLSEEIRIK